jgi:hypothetical protein
MGVLHHPLSNGFQGHAHEGLRDCGRRSGDHFCFGEAHAQDVSFGARLFHDKADCQFCRIEGHNLPIDYRFAGIDANRANKAAVELVGLAPEFRSCL